MVSIKTNYLYSIFYQLLSMIVPIFTIPYLSRIFGAEGMGLFSYTLSVTQYFVIFAMLGLTNYGVRAIAIVRDDFQKLNQTFSEIWVMQFMTGFLVTVFYIVFLFFFCNKYINLYLPQTLCVIATLVDVNWFFFGKEEFRLTVIRNSVIKLLTLFSIFMFIKSEDDSWLYVLLYSGSIFLSALLLWPILIKQVHFIKPTMTGVLKHFKPNCVMFIPVVAVSVYKYMDKIMLGINSLAQAGYYENVEKILTVSVGLVTAFGTVMLPRISNLIANKKNSDANIYLKKSMEFIMFLSIGMACGLYLISDIFVPIYFGPGFEECIGIMRCLSITIIITSWANVIRTQHLIPNHKDKTYVYSVILGAIVNFIGNLLMIPKYGAIGAVYSTIVAEFTVSLSQTIGSDRGLPYRQMFADLAAYFCIGLTMIVLTEFTKRQFCQGIDKTYVLFIVVFFGGFIYLLLSLLYKKIIKKGHAFSKA